jgi:pyruvate/2-oxoglutarate/acetoin dehydrogenase E1 component
MKNIKIFNSKYYKRICWWMDKLAKREDTFFLGQTVLYSGRMYGTLNNVPKKKCLEMPVAEELQMGISIGLSLDGIFPITIYQRMDFLPRAMDQIINHLDKIDLMSHGQFKPTMIIRTTIGSKEPLDVGPQHSQDLTELFRRAVGFSIYKVTNIKEVDRAYSRATHSDGPTMIIEIPDLY